MILHSYGKHTVEQNCPLVSVRTTMAASLCESAICDSYFFRENEMFT